VIKTTHEGLVLASVGFSHGVYVGT